LACHACLRVRDRAIFFYFSLRLLLKRSRWLLGLFATRLPLFRRLAPLSPDFPRSLIYTSPPATPSFFFRSLRWTIFRAGVRPSPNASCLPPSPPPDNTRSFGYMAALFCPFPPRLIHTSGCHCFFPPDTQGTSRPLTPLLYASPVEIGVKVFRFSPAF